MRVTVSVFLGLSSQPSYGKIANMQISVIIPALNEKEAIATVLSGIPDENLLEILVVDGGSSDGTPEIAAGAGAIVIHEARRGYGQACASGLAVARGEIVVFMDADGADDPRDLTKLVAPILMGQSELVLGSRLAGPLDPGSMPWHQKMGNMLSAAMIRHLYGLQLTDLSPFRAVLKQALLSLNLSEMTYGWPTEMITKAARAGCRVVEIPVGYHARLGGASKISGTWKGSVLATYHILSTILRYR